MNAIYSFVKLTIMATFSSHINIGIYGINEPRVFH